MIVVTLPWRSVRRLTMVSVPRKKEDLSLVTLPLMISSSVREIPHCIVSILSDTMEALMIPEVNSNSTWDAGRAGEEEGGDEENHWPEHLTLGVEEVLVVLAALGGAAARAAAAAAQAAPKHKT